MSMAISILNSMPVVLAVAAGGGLGSALRYLVTQIIMPVGSSHFPLAIMVINIVGSFLMGFVVMVLLAKAPDNHLLKTFLTVGMLGGFTTFSTFSLDVVKLLEQGASVMATSYVLGSVILSVGALCIGMMLGKTIV